MSLSLWEAAGKMVGLGKTGGLGRSVGWGGIDVTEKTMELTWGIEEGNGPEMANTGSMVGCTIAVAVSCFQS